MKYYAHSKPGEPAENWQTLEEHLANVADLRWNSLVYPVEKSGHNRQTSGTILAKLIKLFVPYQIRGLYDLLRTQRPDTY